MSDQLKIIELIIQDMKVQLFHQCALAQDEDKNSVTSSCTEVLAILLHPPFSICDYLNVKVCSIKSLLHTNLA